jgi:Ankyrin repeats (many copies)/Ankyrin repeat
MAGSTDVASLLVAIANLDHNTAMARLDATPSLATARLERRDEFFLPERLAQLYEGDTALHAAAFSYDSMIARDLLARGADIRARNRRGAEPLHAAVIGIPGSPNWNPACQRDIILCLIEAGADPNATALGGVTPLHRAVRNRCSDAVETLLRVGADPLVENDSGSTATDLAHWTTGRGGTGTPEAKAEQRAIIELLKVAPA